MRGRPGIAVLLEREVPVTPAHLAGPDQLVVELEIIAPRVLTAPWKTTRHFFRQRNRRYDIIEGVCLEGSFSEETDEDGNAVFVPLPREPDGSAPRITR